MLQGVTEGRIRRDPLLPFRPSAFPFGALWRRPTEKPGHLYTRRPGCLQGDPWFSVPASRRVWLDLDSICWCQYVFR